MWDDGLLNENAAKMRHQNLLREAEQRRLVKALRQSGSDQPGIRAHIARLWMAVGRLMTPSAPKARHLRANS